MRKQVSELLEFFICPGECRGTGAHPFLQRKVERRHLGLGRVSSFVYVSSVTATALTTRTISAAATTDAHRRLAAFAAARRRRGQSIVHRANDARHEQVCFIHQRLAAIGVDDGQRFTVLSLTLQGDRAVHLLELLRRTTVSRCKTALNWASSREFA